MQRRALLQLLAAAPLGLGLGTGPVLADGYPDKALKIVVPFGPGGATDLVARVLAERLHAQLGQSVVVDNRPGASTMIGANAVARAPADGYTLLVSGSSTYTVVPALRNDVPYDPLKDFDLLAVVADAPMVLVVRPDSPYATLQDLLTAAAADKAGLQYATFGPGSAPHLLGEMFALTANIKLSAVPYRGSAQAVMGVMGGEIGMAFDTLSSSLPHIQAGKLRALAVFSAERVPQLPDVPTVAESGLADATFSGWYAVALPAGTPAPVRARLSDALRTALASEKVRSTLDQGALLPVFLDEAAFRQRTEAEITRFRDVAQRAQIEVE
ncbi:tripartite tricarboxylate transporter substrate binding protein [Corticibacter populi]|uniref:Tripartite tricarboxylate transporter substrate binding protein n=1 Tax=Corticibacter populi TaxID=1550736 RepID=A0A3M6QVV8_9BURK|nr:tripartite tricarboxylate transporter substrate binding protein [Corticibacter populi]RMX06622.1 tripartite tricarboxylate transporter substrate binding protein [Corticibacter populi]RZS31808.1 tripartite-type tricarboxylate transporter receptor subunit TctC [Corticibacter populi]